MYLYWIFKFCDDKWMCTPYVWACIMSKLSQITSITKKDHFPCHTWTYNLLTWPCIPNFMHDKFLNIFIQLMQKDKNSHRYMCRCYISLLLKEFYPRNSLEQLWKLLSHVLFHLYKASLTRWFLYDTLTNGIYLFLNYFTHISNIWTRHFL